MRKKSVSSSNGEKEEEEEKREGTQDRRACSGGGNVHSSIIMRNRCSNFFINTRSNLTLSCYSKSTPLNLLRFQQNDDATQVSVQAARATAM